MLSSAAFMGLAMQCAASVHPDTATEIARVESGFNQYAIGVVGQPRGIYPRNLSDALKHVNRLKAEGKNFSIGLMQINQSNFSKYHTNAEQLFNPCNNLAVFEKIITDCYVRGGTVRRAASCYYSGNFTTGELQEKTFANTSYVQRIGYTPPAGGYAVPSVKEEQQQSHTPAPPSGDSPVQTFETWDILREYPRPGAPDKPAREDKGDNKPSQPSGETRTG